MVGIAALSALENLAPCEDELPLRSEYLRGVPLDCWLFCALLHDGQLRHGELIFTEHILLGGQMSVQQVLTMKQFAT
jgi:hypothetical protein